MIKMEVNISTTNFQKATQMIKQPKINRTFAYYNYNALKIWKEKMYNICAEIIVFTIYYLLYV